MSKRTGTITAVSTLERSYATGELGYSVDITPCYIFFVAAQEAGHLPADLLANSVGQDVTVTYADDTRLPKSALIGGYTINCTPS